jgi:bifunctional non-homologous end joining protein LigD
MVPGEKRLAVLVDDHPLEYAAFEGVIPEGRYGAGTVVIWDEGSFEPFEDPDVGLAKGHLSFRLSGKRLRGAFALVRMRGNQWLLIKTRAVDSRQRR